MKAIGYGLAGFMLAAATASVATPPPAEVFFGEADIREAVLSPSGRQLALTSAVGTQRVGLAVFDLRPGGKARRVVQFRDGDVFDVQWQHEGRLLFSVQDDAGLYGEPTGAPGLMAVNADGSEFKLLVKRNLALVTDGSLRSERALDWNHRLLRVPQPREGALRNEVLVGEFDRDGRASLIPFWLDTLTQRKRRVELAGAPAHVGGWLTDRQGELRVAFTFDKLKRGAHWRAPGATTWRQLFETEAAELPFAPHSVDDAGTLYVVQRDEQGFEVLKRFDPERGAPEPEGVVLTPGFDFSGQLLLGRGGAVNGVRVTGDAETTVWLNPVLKALQAEADQLLPGRVNRISCRRCGEPDMSALVLSYSDQDPGRLWLYQAQPPEGEKPWRAVGALRTKVAPEQMGQLSFERIRARDGHELPIWITTPAGHKAGTPLPTIVHVHGGPWVRGHRWGWDPTAQFLASRGYLVIQPEFRGSTGYGDRHHRAGFKHWGRAMQDDVADALLWAQKKGLANDKACIAGASYGGYSTLMGLVRHPELYRCGAAWVAVADLPLLLEGSWFVDDDTSRLSRQHRLPDRIYDSKTEADLVLAHSPVHQASQIKAPVLLAFGADDRRVPLAHGKRMREALQKAGNEPEWVVYDGEGHGWRQLKTRLDFAARLERFFAQHLQPAKNLSVNRREEAGEAIWDAGQGATPQPCPEAWRGFATPPGAQSGRHADPDYLRTSSKP